MEKNYNKYLGAKSNRRYRRLTEIIRARALRIDLKFAQCLSPRMHQTSNNRYNLNGYGCLRITPLGRGLEAPKRHGIKTRLFYPSASFLFYHP